MSMRKGTDYLFGTARIRALEKTLLTKQRIDSMVEGRTLEDSVKVLLECGYGDGQDIEPRLYEELLSQEHQKTVDIVRSLDPELVSIFLLQYDYLNIKILLKSEFLNQEGSIFSSLGEIPVERIRLSIHDRSFAGLSRIMANACSEAIEEFGKTGDPQCIDLILDAACYEEMLQKAEEIKLPFVVDYVKREIDIVNIRSFIRIKLQDGELDLLKSVLIKGGTISLSLFASTFSDDVEAFVQALSHTDYGDLLAEALPSINAGSLGTLEKILDDYKVERLKKAKLVAYGIEPIVAFLAAKENDIKTARIILTGKSANLPDDRIAEKVRGAYV